MSKRFKKNINLFLGILLVLSLSISDLQVSEASVSKEYDAIIKNGTILDGSGQDRYESDIAIKDGHIAKVGDLSDESAEEIVDADGLFVTPGFVDNHSHANTSALEKAKSSLTQGVTTEMMNPDGGGPTDVNQRFDLEEDGLGINVGAYIGFNSVWKEVVGEEDRAATDEEIDEMRSLITTGMEEGAGGVSAGLFYRPAYYATTEEAIDVTSAAKDWRTLFTNHQRNENNEVVEATEETIEIGEKSGVAPVVTHIKTMGPDNWGKSKDMMDLINDANERGVYTTADIYPYLRSQTGLTAIVPPWVEDGGTSAMLDRFADPNLRPQIEEEIEEIMYSRVEGPEGVYFPTERKTLADYMETGMDETRNRTLLAFLNLNYDNEFDVDIDHLNVKNADDEVVYEYEYEGNDGEDWADSKFEELHSYPSNALTYTLKNNKGHINAEPRKQGNSSAYGKVTPDMPDVDDSETTMRFRVGDTMGDNQIIRLWINSDDFGSGSSFPINGYGIALRLDSNELVLRERDNSKSIVHERVDANLEPGEYFDMKVKLEDDNLAAKIWPVSEEEPKEWDMKEDVSKEKEEEEERELTIGETTMQILETQGSLRSIYSFGHEDDFERFFQSPYVAVASDGGASTSDSVHPRRYGTQPRVLGKFVREEGLVDWEEAILKMTAFPAATVGFSDRGYIAEGMKADITIFDPETIIDKATFDEPKQYAEGIEHVFVNGQLALTDGELTEVQAGTAARLEANSPTRPMTKDQDISISEEREISAVDEEEKDNKSSIKFDLEQSSEDVKAEGTLEVIGEDNSINLVSESFGRIQTFDDWMSFTGSGIVNDEKLTTFRVTIDENDPTVEDDRPVVTIDIVGEDQIKGFLGEKQSDEVEKEKLQEKVDEIKAKELEESQYTEDSWEALTEALESAESTLENEEATQSEVDDALAALESAYSGLVESDEPPEEVDKTDLQEKVDEIKAEELDESQYTEESWKALQTATRIADRLLKFDNDKLDQTIIDKSLFNLGIAYQELIESDEPPEGVDKTGLQKKVDEIKAEELDESQYTEASWKALQTAMRTAERLLKFDNDKLDQTIIDKSLFNLGIAHQELEEKN